MTQNNLVARRRGPEPVDAALEAGIGNYRIFNAQMSLKVLIKLIDPATGQVMGRAGAKYFSVEDSPRALLKPAAEKFERLVQKMGAQPVAQGLRGLGLAQNRAGQSLSAAQSAVDLTP